MLSAFLMACGGGQSADSAAPSQTTATKTPTADGDTERVADRDTDGAKARAQNRRVEFVVTKQP